VDKEEEREANSSWQLAIGSRHQLSSEIPKRSEGSLLPRKSFYLHSKIVFENLFDRSLRSQ